MSDNSAPQPSESEPWEQLPEWRLVSTWFDAFWRMMGETVPELTASINETQRY